MKKTYTFNFNREKHKYLIAFLLNQKSNCNDTIRYLIEKEIFLNGIRDLSTILESVVDYNDFDISVNLEESSKSKFPFALSKTEEEDVLKFIAEQGSFVHAIKFLIYKEIKVNGLGELRIPPKRNKKFFEQCGFKKKEQLDSKIEEKKFRSQDEHVEIAIESNKVNDKKVIPDCYDD